MLATNALHAPFLAILPRIRTHARVYFRHLTPGLRKDDAVAEVIALAWKWFLRLAERGRDAALFASALATFAARAVSSGRRFCGQERANDALSDLAHRRMSFTASPLPDGGNAYDEALADNAQTPVPDQVRFRLDWPSWLPTRTERDRQIIGDMALSEQTKELAERYGISPGRVSQLRRQYQADWCLFCAELANS